MQIFRENLNKLPDDASLITKSVESVVDTLVSTYTGMSDYQKTQLTQAEINKYEKIAAQQGKLPEARKYQLNLQVKADTAEAEAVLNRMLSYLRENPAKMDRAEGGKYDHASAINIVTPFTFGSYDGRSELFSQTFTETDPLTEVRLYTGIDYAAYFQTRNAGGTFTTADGWTIDHDKTYWDGVLVSSRVDITQSSTMMSCVVDALTKAGYAQKGAESNYISEINGLAEFDGGPSSGWMGTLNDWFTNYGFNDFSVASGKLSDGDEIRIMYTTSGLGEDLGGSWSNSNTTLKDLSVSGGSLMPVFASGTSGNTYEYTLLISGKSANIRLTPTAANKNFLTKIFLNEKVTSNAEGSSFYKRTQSIPVAAGDTIYVGCGERSWSSMNNQEGNVQANGGTWYVLKVVSSDNAKAHIEQAIAELPAADKITYNNYKTVSGKVQDIRGLLNALSKSEQDKVTNLDKLKAAEAKVQFYAEIDEAKAKLNTLTSSSSSSQAREALAAYEKLSKEQKEYITIADVACFNELAKKYNLNPISGVEEMPESEVATTGKVGSASTSSPTEVKMTGTTAVATIKVENADEILKQAKENQSSEVVLVVADTDAKGADKVELNLDRAFLQSLLKDTKAKLVVKTPFGQKTYDREAMQALADSAAGSTIKAEINVDNVDKIDDEAAKLKKAKELTPSLALTARSAKTAKKNVKVTLKLDKASAASIAELQDLGYTVKYKFYRSTKKASKYAARTWTK